MGKVLIIGIDGGTFDIISPLVKGGKLPNIAGLMKGGAHGILKSTIPPITPTAWASLITGKNPGNHGMFGFVKKNPGSYTTSVCRRDHTDALWCILSEAGKRVIVVNVPMTYPPQEVNGIMISGMNVPSVDSNFIFPESMRKEILSTCKYRIDAFIPDMSTAEDDQIDRMIAEIYEVDDCLKKITTSLMSHDWDFLMTVFTGTDRLQHALWKYTDENHPCYDACKARRYGNVIRDFYQHLDSAIGEILERAGSDVTVLLCSDHGFGPYYYSFPLKRWLLDNGYIKKEEKPIYRLDFNRSDIESEIRKSAVREGRFLRILKWLKRKPAVKLIDEDGSKRLRISLDRNSSAGIKQTIRGLSEGAQYAIRVTAKSSKKGTLLEPGNLQDKEFQFSNETLHEKYKRYEFFFNSTSPTLELSVKATSFGPYPPGEVTISDIKIEEFKWTKATIDHAIGTGGIRINLKGREPCGVVEPSDYEDVRNSFISDLKSIKNEKDEHLLEGVYRREDIYRGDYVEKASDVIPVLNTKFKPSASNRKYFEKSDRWSGNHNLDGIFVIHGEDINSATVSADIIDIAPTILYLMGVPIPDDMDGKVLEHAIKRDFIENSPVEYQKIAGDKSKRATIDDEEQIKERLRGLGYIE